MGEDKRTRYRGSKRFAEKADESLSCMCFRMRGGLAESGTVAWDFIEDEKPNFDIFSLCPPMILSCCSIR